LHAVVLKMEIVFQLIVSDPQLHFPLGKVRRDMEAIQKIKRRRLAVAMEVGFLEAILVPRNIQQLTILHTKGFKQRVHKSFR